MIQILKWCWNDVNWFLMMKIFQTKKAAVKYCYEVFPIKDYSLVCIGILRLGSSFIYWGENARFSQKWLLTAMVLWNCTMGLSRNSLLLAIKRFNGGLYILDLCGKLGMMMISGKYVAEILFLVSETWTLHSEKWFWQDFPFLLRCLLASYATLKATFNPPVCPFVGPSVHLSVRPLQIILQAFCYTNSKVILKISGCLPICLSDLM